jgi:hypothetical protein
VPPALLVEVTVATRRGDSSLASNADSPAPIASYPIRPQDAATRLTPNKTRGGRCTVGDTASKDEC